MENVTFHPVDGEMVRRQRRWNIRSRKERGGGDRAYLNIFWSSGQVFTQSYIK